MKTPKPKTPKRKDRLLERYPGPWKAKRTLWHYARTVGLGWCVTGAGCLICYTETRDIARRIAALGKKP